MSCTRRNFCLDWKHRTQKIVSMCGGCEFPGKKLFIVINRNDSVAAEIWSVLHTGLIHQLGHNKEEQDPAQPGPVLSQGTTEALWSLLPNSKLSSSDCKTKLTSRNTNRRCFACWGLRLFLRCRWHGLRLWCWQGGRPRVDTCQLRSGDTHNTSIMPPLQTT